MASKQEALRERVVQFYNLHLDKKKFTLNHFAGNKCAQKHYIIYSIKIFELSGCKK
jgi:hypothetical protein